MEMSKLFKKISNNEKRGKYNMSQISEDQIIANSYQFFLQLFNDKAKAYRKKKVKSFTVNPFTMQATAKTISNTIDADSIAKAIVYPFVLGTSISTSFGTKTQEFIVTALGDSINGSTTTGMDIEYTDVVDQRRKYCQIKAGPSTINKDDVETIENHFNNLVALGRTNHLNIGMSDRVVGVLYGEPNELSYMYCKLINQGYVVLTGREFWYHLTGYQDLYNKLIDTACKATTQSIIKASADELTSRVKQDIIAHPDKYGL